MLGCWTAVSRLCSAANCFASDSIRFLLPAAPPLALVARPPTCCGISTVFSALIATFVPYTLALYTAQLPPPPMQHACENPDVAASRAA
jgi:hypothetical protein